MLEWFARASEDEKEIMLHVAYGPWLARNDEREERKISQPHEILATVKVKLTDCKLAHEMRVPQLEPKNHPKIEMDG